MMKPIKVIKDPDAFKLLADDTRRQIVTLLRVKEMTVSQISQVLQITPQAVYHHIKKLQPVGIIEVAREERLGHLIESYFRATAELYFCSIGAVSGGPEYLENDIKTSLDALKRIGIKLEYTDEDVKKLAELDSEMHSCYNSTEYEDLINELDDVDFITKQTVKKMADTLSMDDKSHEKKVKFQSKYYRLLKSLLKTD